jgi:2'-5' RNA ligase
MISFETNKDIMELHSKSLEIFNTLRSGLLRDKYTNKEYINQLSDTKRKYIKEYGSEYVLDYYKPHITIARIKDGDIQKEISNKYSQVFRNKTGELDRLQVHTPIFSKNKDEDCTILLYDKEIM